MTQCSMQCSVRSAVQCGTAVLHYNNTRDNINNKYDDNYCYRPAYEPEQERPKVKLRGNASTPRRNVRAIGQYL